MESLIKRRPYLSEKKIEKRVNLMKNGYLVGVDVGGTYTDVFVLNLNEGAISVAKVPTTAPDQSEGFLEAVTSSVSEVSQIATIVHGTTVATNALLERRGAKTGVITTKGFRDVLEMRRRDRPTTWGLWGTFEPIVPRDLRLEVEERILADGTIDTKLDVAEVKNAASYLLEKQCAALSIVFINSYVNNRNEQEAKKAAQEIWPNSHITVSSEILPEIREYERASTATLNAFLQPPVSDYLKTLETSLEQQEFRGQVLIVQSNGGVMNLERAKTLPVRTALSGPAAGVIAAAYIGMVAGQPNIISCDMGGTSFDVSLIVNGESSLSAQSSIGFGMVVRTPMVEIVTIGAGGGSIARVDEGGLLQVGPESAGSSPGPACYGLGNMAPTVTDANVLLGRINSQNPIGGKLNKLDVEAAKSAIQSKIAEPLGINVFEAADAILQVANGKMASAIRLVSVERGHEPGTFAAMPFGGGGALHAGALIKEVGLACALVPRFPGITSALGCVIADMRYDQVQTINQQLDSLDLEFLDDQMVTHCKAGHQVIDCAGSTIEKRTELFELDMLYAGQTHTVTVPLDLNFSGDTTNVNRKIIKSAFEEAYIKEYGRLLKNIDIRVMNVRISVIGHRPKFDLTLLAPSKNNSLEGAITEKRSVYINGDWSDVKIFDRLSLPIGAEVHGPAVLEQPDTTIFLEDDMVGLVDIYGNFLIKVQN